VPGVVTCSHHLSTEEENKHREETAEVACLDLPSSWRGGEATFEPKQFGSRSYSGILPAKIKRVDEAVGSLFCFRHQEPRLASTLRPSCLCLPSIRITGTYHHTWPEVIEVESNRPFWKDLGTQGSPSRLERQTLAGTSDPSLMQGWPAGCKESLGLSWVAITNA
jgi:hypothetical protein